MEYRVNDTKLIASDFIFLPTKYGEVTTIGNVHKLRYRKR